MCNANHHLLRISAYSEDGLNNELTQQVLQNPENIEGFTEDQAFSPSKDLAPPRPPPPLARQQVVFLSQSFCGSPVELTDGREGVSGGGVETYDGEKTWSSINHSILKTYPLVN
jgi:hypothetical protein